MKTPIMSFWRHAMNKTHRLIYFYLIMTLCLGWLFFLSLSLTDNYSWHGDAGLYLQHAKNIFEGKPYRHLIDGQIFAPGYPMLLAIWAVLFSWKLATLKLIAVIALGCTAILVFLLFKDEIGAIPASIIGLLTLLSPALVIHRQIIASDIPFMAFSFAALLCWFRSHRFEPGGSRRSVYWNASGFVLAFLACLIRPAGFPLVIAGAISSMLYLVKKRDGAASKFNLFIIILTGISFAVSIVSERFFTQFIEFSTKNLDYINDNNSNILEFYRDKISSDSNNYYNSITFWPQLNSLTIDPMLEAIFQNLFAKILLISMVIGGLFIRFRKTGGDTLNLFFSIYIIEIIIVPWSSGIRYFLPIIPLSIGYIAYSLEFIFKRTGNKTRKYIYAVISLCVLSYYTARSIQISDKGEIVPNAATLEPALNWLKAHTGPDERICSFLSSNTAYLIQRRTCSLTREAQDTLIEGGGVWMKQREVKFVFVPLNPNISPLHQRLAPSLLVNPTLMVVFRNDDYVIFAPKP